MSRATSLFSLFFLQGISIYLHLLLNFVTTSPPSPANSPQPIQLTATKTPPISFTKINLPQSLWLRFLNSNRESRRRGLVEGGGETGMGFLPSIPTLSWRPLSTYDHHRHVKDDEDNGGNPQRTTSKEKH